MNGFLHNVVEKAKITFDQAVDFVKEGIQAITSTTATIPQIAEFIRQHPDAIIRKEELLGLSYTFYKLERNGIQYYMETKGSFILQLDVSTKGHTIVSYRSYRDKETIDHPIRFAENPIEN